MSRPVIQHVRDPAPGACRQKPLPLQLFLLLHRHLLHRRLRGRDPADMALPAAGGHHDLRGSGGAASAGEGRPREACPCCQRCDAFVFFPTACCYAVVRGADLPVDGEAEVWRKLQPPQSADGETRSSVCQRTKDRSAHGFSQRILCPSEAAGREQNKRGNVSGVHSLSWNAPPDSQLRPKCFVCGLPGVTPLFLVCLLFQQSPLTVENLGLVINLNCSKKFFFKLHRLFHG